MRFRAIGDRILVKVEDQASATKGGILIPDNAKEKSTIGIVVSVGEGTRTKEGKIVPLSVKEKDRVIFEKHRGTELKLDGEDYLVLVESHVLGIMN